MKSTNEDDGVDWAAYTDGFITITVEFMKPMAMNNVLLATWIYLGAALQILNGVTQETRVVEVVMTPGFNNLMVGRNRPSGSEVVRPGPESNPRPPGGNMNTSGTDIMDRVNPNALLFRQPSIQVAVAASTALSMIQASAGNLLNAPLSPSLRDKPKGTGDFTFTVSRRDNESVWIDPESGWQAVQASHAARGLGYNISHASDYLAIKPSSRVAQ